MHIFFSSGTAGISALMRRLLTGYAVYYNRRHRRHGQLFQNRYKSIICQEDAYLQELIRYIHLNPLRARIVHDVRELDSYDYGGHSTVMGKKKREWQDDKFVLGFFGKKVTEARRNYRAYVEKGIELGRRPELVGGGLISSLVGWDEVKKMRLTGQNRIKSDQRILGESDFVLRVLSESEEKFERKYKLRSLGYDYKKILERVSSIFDLEKDYITGKGRQKERVEARDVLCYWCVLELGITMANLAKRLGLTISAVSYAVQRGERIVKEKGFQLES